MNQKTDTDYGRKFRILAVQNLPHHSLLVLALKSKSPRLIAHLDRRVRDKINYTPSLIPTDSQLQEYNKATSHTYLWHGTGRLQYNNGEIVDTLDAIARNNALAPHYDIYSIVLSGKEMVSLSTTNVRIIARSYADRHGLGIKEPNRYGSSLWWVAYYYNLCYAEILVKYGMLMAKNLSAFNRASRDKNGERVWGKRVHAKAKSVWDTFGLGSDIAGNYPVLFGIKETTDVIDLPKSMQKWEVRISEPVPLNSISHIEVPEQKVKEVRQLLLKYGHRLPVFPLEYGEYLASQQSLADLLHPAKKPVLRRTL